MTTGPREGRSGGFRLLFFLLIGAASPSPGHQDLTLVLDRLGTDIAADTANLGKRATRAWLLVDHGEAHKAQADIRRLLGEPAWRAQGGELEARRLFLAGDARGAKAALSESLREGGATAPKLRLLARIEIARGDTAAALEAGRRALQAAPTEEDFLFLLTLWQNRVKLPAGTVARGLRDFPAHAAVADALFQACLEEKADLPCLVISKKALEWWPASIDWRVKQARALQRAGELGKARRTLAETLELVDSGSQADGTARELRREIFALLQSMP